MGVDFEIVLSLVCVGFNPTVGFYIILLYMSRIIHICYKKTGQAHWIRIIGLSFDDDHEFDLIFIFYQNMNQTIQNTLCAIGTV